MDDVSLEHNVSAARREHLISGRELHLRGVHGQRFCEVGLITGTSQANAVANIWNTTGSCDPTPEQFDLLDPGAVAGTNAAAGAWLNPVRHWMADGLDIRELGDDRDFGHITGTWVTAVGAATVTEIEERAYRPGYSPSTTTFTFSSGTRVYLLDAPDGEVFVLQSFSQHWDMSLTERDLAHLYRRLTLPERWGFRTEVVDQDLAVTPNSDGLAHVMQDDAHNVYLGSDVGRAFTQLTPKDSLW